MDLVLYRKYRPRSFAEVVEQRHVTHTLSNALKMGKIAHAYLFCGPRGVGKTTIARVIAKAMNCERATELGDACNACVNCRLIEERKTLDVIEIDAASNRGIDEIRNLQERIKHPPAHLKYKVFIIDEVHMMTQGAFNALLKTLEEPPAHAIFLFATTETHKVPATILSRCQRFDLKKVSLGEITRNLSEIASKEGVEIEPDAVQLVAISADGCLRDAQSLLMQVLAIGSPISLAQVKDLLAIPDFAQVSAFVDALRDGQARSALELVGRLADDGGDLQVFARQVIDYIRKVLVARINPDMQARVALEFADAARERFAAHVAAPTFSIEYLMRALKAFVDASDQIKSAVMPQLPLELAVVNLISAPASAGAPTVVTPVVAAPKPPVEPPRAARAEALIESVRVVEEATPVVVAPAAPATVAVPVAAQAVAAPTVAVEQQTESATPATVNITLEGIRARWAEVVEVTRKYNHSVSAFLQVGWPTELKGNQVMIAFKFEFHKERIRDIRNRQIVERVLDEVFTEKLAVNCLLQPDLVVKAPVQNVEPVTPVDAAAEKQLLDQVLEVFGGKVVE